MDQLIHRLLRRAHLFDDPTTYEAGVRDALEAVAAAQAASDSRRVAESMREHPAGGARRALSVV